MKKIIFLILIGFTSLPLWSKTDSIDSLLADILDDEQDITDELYKIPVLHFLYMGTMLNNRTFYAGREIGENMVNLNGSIFYFNSWGLFIGASGTWFSQLDPGYNSTITAAGIIKSTGKKTRVTFRAAYSRYFYNPPDPAMNYSLKNNLGTGLTVRNKWIGARASMNLKFGENIGINASSAMFSSITIMRIEKFNKIVLKPEISFFLGSETIEYENLLKISSQLTDSQPSIVTEEAYGLLNIQFYIPICLIMNNFELEIGYSVNVPFTKVPDTSYPSNTFISATLGYMVPLN
jgi:hypothetical protein